MRSIIVIFPLKNEPKKRKAKFFGAMKPECKTNAITFADTLPEGKLQLLNSRTTISIE
jgi:hypothetical protein